MTQTVGVRFKKKDDRKFYATVRKRVDSYFKEKGIDKFGGNKMIFKTIIMVAIYVVPYFLMLFFQVQNVWLLLLGAIIMGFGIGGIGLSVMHDANHGAYSSKPKVNRVVGFILNFVGANSINWRIQHNVLHHSFTNIDHHDEDIQPAWMLRFSPHGEHRSIHKWQHLYAWFFYGLMTFSWVIFKDFNQITRYNKMGLLKRFNTTLAKEWAVIIITKVIYFSYIFVVPLLVLDIPWWGILLGVFIMHYVAGMTLALIFQPAHVMEECEFPMPDDEGNMQNTWAIHQLLTTCNFAKRAKIFSWYVGGLNFQIEHHLFPDISHVHYRKISRIVKQTAQEFDLPYYEKKTFGKALRDHFKFLKKLGNPQVA